jgi:K+-sensing histidine kinase KdpD
LRTAVMNAIHNTVKFSPERGILRIRHTTRSHNSTTIQLAVEDEGPGISPGDREDHNDSAQSLVRRKGPRCKRFDLVVDRYRLIHQT